jgi:pilus assembly protein Flp/PilA
MSGSDALSALRRFAADESGATAIEYATLAAGIGATIAAVVWQLGSRVKENFYDRLASLFG